VSHDGKAMGVSLGSHQFVEADAVVINADLIYAYKALLPSKTSARDGSNRSKSLSCSSISFYWSLSKKVPELETHNMFVENSFGKRSTNIYLKRHGLLKPSFYVHVPSRIDPSAAPAGKDAVIVLVLVENLGDSDPDSEDSDLDKLIAYARGQVISSIEKRTGAAGFEELIDHESINTPLTWQKTFNSERGAIFGLDHSFFNILSFRPKIKHHSADGIYFVGASTHPGAGVPTCLAGARLTAERVLRDLEVHVPWESPNPKTSHPSSQFFAHALFARSSWKWIFFALVLYMAIGLALRGIL
jgi:phytoene desaturase (3,4-didehydrolycopene-forming)